MTNLNDLGWNTFFKNQLEAGLASHQKIGRISTVQRTIFSILTESGDYLGKSSGKLNQTLRQSDNSIVVGDFVIYTMNPEDEFAQIQMVFERQNVISRQAPGNRESATGKHAKRQFMAANVDTVFIVSALDRDFNPRRIERYLTLVYDCGAMPKLLLNKADLCPDTAEKLAAIEPVVLGAPVVTLNARNESDIQGIGALIQPGETTVFLGSSGVGKSTIINGLLGYDRQKTASISGSVDKGRHTTTTRELFILPKGGIVIDTPGMRELQPHLTDDAVTSTFEDIESLARYCRFHDCGHQVEPGCAVLQAVDAGELDASRYQNYLKLKKEVDFWDERQVKESRQIEKEKWRHIKMEARRLKKRHK